MLELDGSGGGGQLVRTALTLSAVTGRGFEMRGIRGDRPNPGLRPQHLAAARTIAEVTGGDLGGASEGAEALEFRPGPIRPGRYEIDVGTAGSLTLLFDTVLPLVHGLDGNLTLVAEGGTDVRWAPTMDYYRRVKLPLLRRFGLPAAVDVERRGFYPAGGGKARLVLAGSTMDPLSLTAPSARASARVYSLATETLADGEVAERQAQSAREGLEAAGVAVAGHTVEYVTAHSTGSAIAIQLERGDTLAGADALGERGTKAEAVADEAVTHARATLESGAAVDANLADQLLVFLALAGGRVSIPRPTDHVKASQGVLDAFGFDVSVESEDGKHVLVGSRPEN